MKKNPKFTFKTVTEPLLAWFDGQKRDLPFRKNRTPYRVWLAEIMGQQTQIDTFVPYYERFLAAFPNVETLASADEADVLNLWKGLGYYSRARSLHKAAKIIVNEMAGEFPDTYDTIIKLPGVGPYTAAAIASIAFGEAVPAVDGNVTRVVTRLTDDPIDIAENRAKTVIADKLRLVIPADRPGDFNEALMDFGATLCVPKQPVCLLCPLRVNCAAFFHGTVGERPIKSKRTRSVPVSAAVAIIIDDNGRVFLERRPDKGLLAGLWGFPIVENTDDEKALRAMLQTRFQSIAPGEAIGNAVHVFTHKTWQMTVYRYRTDISAVDGGVFAPLESISGYALPVAFSKVLETVDITDQ